MRSAPESFYFQASNGSVALPVAGYNYNSDWTPLLAGLSPARMAASLAAPEPYVRLSRIRLVWGFLCQGSITPFLSSFVISFFCSTRAASILPSRLHISIAVARSGGQGRCFFSSAEGLSLTDVSTAAGSLAIGWLAAR
jgi:hypothetical protein